MIRVRIAPSPTGIPHIGNTRTALFNYLFSKRNKGTFIVRIEDTDRARFVKEAEDAIYEILRWLTIDWDEEYVQSKRLDIYKEHAEILKKKGYIYESDGALRFKMPKEGITEWTDGIGNKKIVFENKTQEDFVAIKSDGFPTYNFANVVDDYLMKISHVIRGEEFISSTPKHIQLYKAFGWSMPQFVHLPVVLGPDKTKLSKRHGAKSALVYRDEGYLREALLNYMATLGWKPKGVRDDLEMWDMKFMTEQFDLKDINTNSPIFDSQKLLWFNGKYMREAQSSKLKAQIADFYKGDKEMSSLMKDRKLDFYIGIAKTRMKTLSEFKSLVLSIMPSALTLKQEELARKLKYVYELLKIWEPTTISGATIAARDELNARTKDIYTVLTGKSEGLPFEQKIYAQGKSGTISWLDDLLSKKHSKP